MDGITDLVGAFLLSNNQKTSTKRVDVTAPPLDGNGHAYTQDGRKDEEKRTRVSASSQIETSWNGDDEQDGNKEKRNRRAKRRRIGIVDTLRFSNELTLCVVTDNDEGIIGIDNNNICITLTLFYSNTVYIWLISFGICILNIIWISFESDIS